LLERVVRANPAGATRKTTTAPEEEPMRNSIFVLAAAALLALPGAVSAQASGSITALATVLTPLAVSNQADLLFGDVIPGVPSTVAPADANAGRFLVSGSDILQVSLDFGSLPTVLNHETTTSTLPLSFGAASAGVGTGPAAVGATFDPTAAYNSNLDGGALYVFIGGTVSPTFDQEAGVYDGTLTLTVAYTGN
jgi:hypothetical protein